MIRRTALALSLILGAPTLALAAAPATFDQLANLIVQILNNATATLIIAGIVVYFFGVSSNMIKVGKGETTDMRSYLVWGIAIIFVMVSVWGILQLLQNTLFGNGGYNSIGGSTSGAPCQSFTNCSFGQN